MRQTCAVINCGYKSTNAHRLCLFRIPGDTRNGKINKLAKQRRELWIQALRRDDLTESDLKEVRICSKHFISGKPSTLYDHTNPDWVPSVNMCLPRRRDDPAPKNSQGHVNKLYRLKVKVVPSRNLPWSEKKESKEVLGVHRKLRIRKEQHTENTKCPKITAAVYLKEEPLLPYFPEVQRVYNCKFCHFTATSMFTVVNHENRHFLMPQPFNCAKSAVKPFQCKDCDFSTNLTITFKQHVDEYHVKKCSEETETQNVTRTYICKHCNFKTHSLLVLLKHILNDCISSLAPPCTKLTGCDFAICSVGVLGKSLKMNQEWLKCDQCNYTTKSRSAMKSHRFEQHSQVRGKPPERPNRLSVQEISWFLCGLCTYKTKTRLRYEQHAKKMHLTASGVPWYTCEYCQYQTKVLWRLHKHQKKQHFLGDQIRWFECDRCDFTTTKKKYLEDHKTKRHRHVEKKLIDGVRWFHCEKCEYKTTVKAYLIRHKKEHLKRPKIPWFECAECGYKSKYRSSLKTHLVLKHMEKAP